MTDHHPVTVIGLGAMGREIARVLLEAGHPTTVWNRNLERAVDLVSQGATRADTVVAAVGASPLVLVCVLDYAATRELLEPIAADLAGRTVVQLTTGTPKQARELAEWAAGHGIDYVDSGMMATPPMIGRPGSTFLYSGDEAAFERYRPALDLLGTSRWFGADAGLASLYDLALLSGMYTMFAGFLHGAAMVGTAGVSAADFAESAGDWLRAMTVSLPYAATFVDSGDYTTDVQDVEFNKSALDVIVQASIDQGVAPDLVAPIHELLARQLAEGHGKEAFDRIIESIRPAVTRPA
ncbi:NAD(P)-dependent oxidoreductase [Jiangella alkaliphila]|uniref:3-hydroxyisobutyrate dehydrogenase n=1 Tax=Jiangella alkaliphila TaxID=419479 RepID=A0A1H2IPN0_9ACTN|nr:NAD(P)-binding domain-containing protein [Jiangella alkaliphila]SDU46002.1 3-hydroxyisobutyrate dehydrogenase [Jiangella alkaliphila]